MHLAAFCFINLCIFPVVVSAKVSQVTAISHSVTTTCRVRCTLYLVSSLRR